MYKAVDNLGNFMTATKKVKVDIYSNEEPLFLTALFISVLAWGGLLVATKGLS